MHPHAKLTNLPSCDALAADSLIDAATLKVNDPDPLGSDLVYDQPIFDRLRKLALRRQEENAAKEELEKGADARNELWTVQAALYRNVIRSHVFAFCVLGSRKTDEDRDAFRAEHPDSMMTMDPIHMVGSKAEIISQVAAMFKCDEYTVRFVG